MGDLYGTVIKDTKRLIEHLLVKGALLQRIGISPVDGLFCGVVIFQRCGPQMMKFYSLRDNEIYLDIGNEEKINNTFEIICQWMDKLLIPKMNELCATE